MKRPAQYYPAFLRLEGRKCLVVGGGNVACRKVKALQEAGARVHVVSLQFCAPLKRTKGIERRRRPYRTSDLRGATLVISATGDQALNRRVAREATARGILVNVVDQPALCSFIVPATVRRGRLSVAISTGGASPALAAQIRRRLSRQWGVEYSRLLEALVAARAEAMRRITDSRLRRKVLQRLISPSFLRLAKTSPASVVRREMLRRVCSFTR